MSKDAPARTCPNCQKLIPPGKVKCGCTVDLGGWEGAGKAAEDGRSSTIPPILGKEKLPAAQRELPQGVRGSGNVKRSLRIDLVDTRDNDDLARERPVAASDGSPTRQWYNRRGRPISLPTVTVPNRNGQEFRVDGALTLEKYREKEAKKKAQNRASDQDFGTSPRMCRRPSGGSLDASALPPTTRVYRSDPQAKTGVVSLASIDEPEDDEPELDESAEVVASRSLLSRLEHLWNTTADALRPQIREALRLKIVALDTALRVGGLDDGDDAHPVPADLPPEPTEEEEEAAWETVLGLEPGTFAAERVRDEDLATQRANEAQLEAEAKAIAAQWLAEASCQHCGDKATLRRGLCDACRKYLKRTRKLPPPDVLQRRRWARNAPITDQTNPRGFAS